jgi:dephospho-CoA kinase
LVVGVAGIMGSGKSTVAQVLEDLGAKKIDADTLGRELLKEARIKEKIVEVFGRAVIGKGGEIDPARLAKVAFSDAGSARDLDSITREALIERIRTRIAALRGSEEMIVVDAALLPEWESRDWIDILIVVDSSEEAAVQRASLYRGFDPGNVRARMKHQLSRGAKKREADVILPNYGSLEELKQRSRKVFWTLLSMGRKE